MTRQQASSIARQTLNDYGLDEWGVALSTEPNSGFHGLCDFKTQTIILNAYSMEFLPESEAIDTIKHEVAHAIAGPIAGHGPEWQSIASKMGVRTMLCTKAGIPEHVIDAIRSGHLVTVEVEETVIKKPVFKVTKLQDKCPDCGKVAKEAFSIDTTDSDGNAVKLITLECFHIIKKVTPRGTPYETMISNDWKPEIKNCKHQWTKTECDKCGEYKLFNFQIIGARGIEAGLAIQKGFGVFDEMGLGKTVQALAYIRFAKERATPTLYVVKSALKFQWFQEIIRWIGPDYLAQIISTSKDFLFPNLKSYIIPYDLLRRFPREKLKAIGIKLVVLDECQQIKNPDSSRTQEVRNILQDQNIKVIPLSGTPWKNRGGEFFPSLNMINPIKFHTYQGYLDNWVEYYYKGATRKQGGIRNIAKFKEYTKDLLIRREFDEVMDEFPSVNRTKLNVKLDEIGQSSYDDATSEFVKWYNEKVIGGEEENALNGMEILAKLTRMRHITGLAKIPATLGFVESFVEDTDRKLVIFVHHKDVGMLIHNSLINTNKETNPDWYDLAKECLAQGIKIFKYGSEHTGKKEGYDIQQQFNNTKRCIMVASTLACGEGMNLQTCADAIMHERQWNPMNEDQAAPGRFKRIGQVSRVINVTFTEADDTIDQYLDDINETKGGAFHDVMNSSERKPWNQGDSMKLLAEMIITKFKKKNPNRATPVKSITEQVSY